MTDTMDGTPAAPDPTDPVDLLDLDSPVEELVEQWLEQSLAEIGDEPADEEQVDRLLWVLRRLRQRQQEIADAVTARLDLLLEWRRTESGKIQARVDHIEETLAGWAFGEHERTARKTWKLPAGELTVRARRERVVLTGKATDEGLVGAVAALVPDAIKTTREVQPGRVKAVGQATGVDVTNSAVAMGVEVPEGYEAQRLVVVDDPHADEPSFSEVPGVFVLVPKPGREGQKFSAVTDR